MKSLAFDTIDETECATAADDDEDDVQTFEENHRLISSETERDEWEKDEINDWLRLMGPRNDRSLDTYDSDGIRDDDDDCVSF